MIDQLHPVTQDKQMVECPDCRGNGFIESRVPFEEAMKELKYRLRTIGII